MIQIGLKTKNHIPTDTMDRKTEVPAPQAEAQDVWNQLGSVAATATAEDVCVSFTSRVE